MDRVTPVARSNYIDHISKICSYEHMRYNACGWHDRGYLPHLELIGRATGITFRLADSLPKHVIEKLKEFYSEKSDPKQAEELSRQIATYEDAGVGRCWLRDQECARIVAEAICYFNGERYDLIEWCVMPNHVHVIVNLRASYSFENIVRSWKNYTARRINLHVGNAGRLWATDYFDRVIRDEEHLVRARRYVRMNPVKAGLCHTPEEWRWSSAYKE
jgi:REP element-mobilizing transposase RayT